MDSFTKAFVEEQSVARYGDLIKAEKDPAKRKTLLKLLAEEEAKMLKPST